MDDNLYVNKLITGSEDHQEAIDYFKEANSVIESAGVNLKTWA